MNLESWGWDGRWAAVAEALESSAAAEPGRVIEQGRDRWVVQRGSGPFVARITSASFAGPFPVTGDWVLVEPGPMPTDPVSIVTVLPRDTAISRGVAGSGAAEHVLAANVDTVWIVHGLDAPLNPRRLERYLAVAWESGAVPEIVLTKADLGEEGPAVTEVGAVALGVRVHVVSVERPETIRGLQASLRAGRTVALLGPSGAGKSTLVNALAGTQLAETGAVRDRDRKGRHTTAQRELFQVPGGFLLLDTPGLRELRVWELADGLEHAFPDIEALAAGCRFRDCRHEVEPGCAVMAAVEGGGLAPDRLEGFRKLRAEAAYAERRADVLARTEAVARHKTALKTLKYHPKYRRED